MSNSQRANDRRSKRSKLTKHQRTIVTQQHWGDSQGKNRKQRQLQEDSKLASMLGLLKGK